MTTNLFKNIEDILFFYNKENIENINTHIFDPINDRKNHPYQQDRTFPDYIENQLCLAAYIITPSFKCSKCGLILLFCLNKENLSYDLQWSSHYDVGYTMDKLKSCSEIIMSEALS